ncbi:MAG: hypothetical protein PUC05_03960 [Firmicutes bacterium]|nr:hypothetical protein [Bacillota bacterium]
MRFYKTVLCLMLISVLLCGCNTGIPGNTDIPGNTTGTAATESPTDTGETPAEFDMYGDGTGINLLVGIDEFGRVLEPCTARREGKSVGMFYWLWHGSYPNTIIDTSKLIEEKGLDYVLHNADEYNPTMQPHYWGEPLYGYYSSLDGYVLRKHLELLSYAGIDFIMFDATNTITYPAVVRKICEIILEMQEDGFDVPLISYYTHTASIDTVRQIYREIYTKERYRSTWFCVEGKPLIVAQTDVDKDRERTRSQHSHLASYDPQPLSQEILDFFYFRTPSWVGMDPVTPDGWPWVDWSYPPAKYGNVISVSCASHHQAMFSWAVMDPEDRPQYAWNSGQVSWGRGYDVNTGKNITENAAQGTFYQSVWDSAIQRDPDFIFVGGWNEWMCGVGYDSQKDVYQWYDSFNMEFSRDAELMKGGYNDAFLMQTAINARRYQYSGQELQYKKAVKKTVDITAGTGQWQDVNAVYKMIGQTNYGRSSVGAISSVRYEQAAAKNGLQEVRITSDDRNIYFYIRCDGDIVLEAENSVNLFIGTGTPEQKGWESYEFVINRLRRGNIAVVERLDALGQGTEAGEARMHLDGAVLQLEVPRAVLGLEGDAFYFKVADSVENPTDIMDYYVSGRSMPMGRFSYQYLG